MLSREVVEILARQEWERYWKERRTLQEVPGSLTRIGIPRNKKNFHSLKKRKVVSLQQIGAGAKVLCIAIVCR
jgi:hypothetical protein